MEIKKEKIISFENLLCWQKSKDLAIIIYKLFEKNKDFWFKNQIERAVISISNNIAEWFERQTNKELKYFLYVAKWSSWETKNMIIIWKELWYITEENYKKLIKLTEEISKILYWFIKSIS